MIGTFPDQIQRDYYLANDFSAFLFVLRTIYNMIISEGKNEEANITWEKLKPDLNVLASVDLDKPTYKFHLSFTSRVAF